MSAVLTLLRSSQTDQDSCCALFDGIHGVEHLQDFFETRHGTRHGGTTGTGGTGGNGGAGGAGGNGGNGGASAAGVHTVCSAVIYDDLFR